MAKKKEGNKNPKYQQGDVLLFPVTEVKGKKIDNKPLALGEVTGHCHAVTKGDFQLYEDGGTLYLSAKSECALTHEEHGLVTVAPGEYRVGIVREYSYADEEARRVAD